ANTSIAPEDTETTASNPPSHNMIFITISAMKVFARIMGEVLVFWFFAFEAGFVFLWAGRKSPVPVLSIVA
ncbi:hypothetical protein AB9E35_33380, partial [Rhizobium leguminosarum]